MIELKTNYLTHSGAILKERVIRLGANDLKAAQENGYSLFLYGAGDAVSSYARIAKAALDHHNISFEAFIDDDEARVGTKFLGHSIISSKVQQNFGEKTVILIASNYFRSILVSPACNANGVELSSLVGILEDTPPEAYIGLMSNEEVQRRLHTHKSKLIQYQGLSSGLYLNALDVQVTERCTMKCKDCSNLMQYYQRPMDADQDILVRAMNSLLAAIDHLADARVIGGEPFMVKDLDKILALLIESEKVGQITIYTNGTIVPRPNIIELLRASKIVIEITDYDAHSRNLGPLVAKLREERIRHFAHKPQNWTDSARIVKNTLNEAQLSQMFDACCVNDALTLLHGDLYHCPFSANAVNLRAIPSSREERINLIEKNSPEDLRARIQSWYFQRPYLDACKFCLGRDYLQPKVEPGVQIGKPIPIPVVVA